MSRSLSISLALFLFLAWLSSNSIGQVIYDNGVGGAANVNDAFSSDLDVDIVGGDDFMLATTMTFSRIEWTGLYAFDDTPPVLDLFNIRIHADAAGSPGIVLNSYAPGNAVNRTDSGFVDPGFGFTIYNYSVDIASFTAMAATNYWLSIFGNTVGENDDWLWGIINGAGNSAQSDSVGTNWTAQGHQMDFRLVAVAVPEPTSAGFVCAFLAGILSVRRKRRLS